MLQRNSVNLEDFSPDFFFLLFFFCQEIVKLPSKVLSIFLVQGTKRPYFPQGLLAVPSLLSGTCAH